MPRNIPLDQIRIAAPCTIDWDQMRGDDRVRRCGSCDRSVYNISGMSSAAAQRLIGEAEGRLCVRFYRRHDGTVLTADCPIGRRAARWARAKVAACAMLVAGAIAATAAAVRTDSSTTTAAAGNSAGWMYQTRAYQAFQRWLNPAPPPPMMGTPALGMMAPPRAIMGEVNPPVQQVTRADLLEALRAAETPADEVQH